MHSSLEPTHASNNGAASRPDAEGGGGGGATGPTYDSLYDEPEDTTGVRQTLIQVPIISSTHILSNPGALALFMSRDGLPGR